MATWQQRQLGDCLTLRSGGTPSKARNDYWGGDIAWVSCKDMKVERIHICPAPGWTESGRGLDRFGQGVWSRMSTK